MTVPVFELRCRLQNYPTGKTGLDGLAAQLAHKSRSHHFELDHNTQYAELWMGTHENGASELLDGTLLQEHVDTDKEYFLGRPMLEKFKGDSTVPFLFKILTARKALQLQIHPNKQAAEALHEKNPEEFKDANHKPEIALAITDCEIFAGFRPATEINNFLNSIPELVEIFGVSQIPESESKEEQTAVLKKILGKLFDMEDSRSSYETLMNSPNFASYKTERSLLERANEMYPGDSGAFIIVFLMNYFVLSPGSAAYVKEDGIHAWFTGDMVECMAVSDNVLNTGFLPASDRQKSEFLDLVRYDCRPNDDHAVDSRPYEKSSSGNGRTIVYDPPIEEFSILRTELDSNESESIRGVDGPGILICTRGSATLSFHKEHPSAQGKGGESGTLELTEGHVFFVAAGTELSYVAGQQGLQVHEAISGEMMNRDGDIQQ